MPKKQSEKCRLCSKLSADEAIARHGPAGTNCWVGEPCHKRRSYYRNRALYNGDKREKYAQKVGKTVVNLNLPIHGSPKVELFLYRKTKASQPHAIVGQMTLGKKVFQDGVHPDKLFNVNDADEFKAQCHTFTQDLLEAFSVQAGKTIAGYNVIHERSPSPDLCPICRGDIPEKDNAS
ncbi:MAG: hypothetical protein HC852_02070 [Acaryochloridaceae cyanobacterium RU_4_10]|nr:hypothetical protein [Acaryochloridaceae cyanobacterium RU_4_10]